MAKYNFIERKLAKVLSENPTLKNFLKRQYQRLNYILYKKKFTFSSKYNITKVSNSNLESFYGYYDKNPRSLGLELFHETSYNTVLTPMDSISILGECTVVVKNIQTEEVIFKKNTKAFNWQQGAKLQWVGESSFIYNDVLDSSICSQYVSLGDGGIKKLKHAVYDTYKDEFYLSLDYRQLAKLRPDYGYFIEGGWGNLDSRAQSILYCDFEDNVKTLLDIESLNKKHPLNSFCSIDAQKFNHIMLSPCGNFFVFLHRAYTNVGKRIDRFFLTSINNSNDELRLISDSGMISHYCWINSSSLIAYMRHKEIDGYYKITINDKIEFERIDVLGLDSYGDGHPTYIGNDCFITDTYPDKSRMKSLLLVDMDKKTVTTLGEFLEPLEYLNQTRCDLHPKWDAENKNIYIDSVHEGKRSLYRIGPIL